MKNRILSGILCVVFTAVAYTVANNTVFHIPASALTTVGMGVFLGVVAAYTVVFSKPTLLLSFLKPAFILALLAGIFITIGLPHQALMRDWTLIAGVLSVMAGIGVCGGLGYNLGLKLGR